MANNNSKKNVYVDSMYVNGEKYDKTFIKYEDLIKGGTIEFNMSSTPNKERGLEQDSLTSITKDDNKPQVYTDYSKDANKSSSTGVTTLDNLFDVIQIQRQRLIIQLHLCLSLPIKKL